MRIHKITRRNFMKVVGVSALAMGLAACGGSSSSTAASTSTAASASTAAGGEVTGDKVVINIGHINDQSDSWHQGALKFKEYCEANSNGTIEVDVFPNSQLGPEVDMIQGILSDSGTVDIGTTVKIGHFSQEGRELDLNQRVYDFIHDIGDEVRTDEGTFTAKAMMERFLFPSDLQSVPIGRLSGGERRRLYLLSILMEAPNVLLLDEPTNDLDVMTLSILEDYLQGFPGPILIVSHDRFLLDKLAEQVFEVRDGEVLRYSGNWSDWKAKRKEEEAPAKAEKPKAAQERPRERKLKFSFKEQREFETIDEDLAALEQQIRECEEAQGACGSDYVKLQELQAKQAELEAALEEKTERWMYLTELKEKIDAQ